MTGHKTPHTHTHTHTQNGHPSTPPPENTNKTSLAPRTCMAGTGACAAPHDAATARGRPQRRWRETPPPAPPPLARVRVCGAGDEHGAPRCWHKGVSWSPTGRVCVWAAWNWKNGNCYMRRAETTHGVLRRPRCSASVCVGGVAATREKGQRRRCARTAWVGSSQGGGAHAVTPGASRRPRWAGLTRWRVPAGGGCPTHSEARGAHARAPATANCCVALHPHARALSRLRPALLLPRGACARDGDAPCATGAPRDTPHGPSLPCRASPSQTMSRLESTRKQKPPTKNIGWWSCVSLVPREKPTRKSSGADRTLPGTGGSGLGTFKWRGLHVSGFELPLWNSRVTPSCLSPPWVPPHHVRYSARGVACNGECRPRRSGCASTLPRPLISRVGSGVRVAPCSSRMIHCGEGPSLVLTISWPHVALAMSRGLRVDSCLFFLLCLSLRRIPSWQTCCGSCSIRASPPSMHVPQIWVMPMSQTWRRSWPAIPR